MEVEAEHLAVAGSAEVQTVTRPASESPAEVVLEEVA